MRDKLIEIIAEELGSINFAKLISAGIADRLIENNVILLPDKLKDSWELTSSFVLSLFCSNEEELDKMKREFEFQNVNQILTDIRKYLNGLLAEWNGSDIKLESISLVEKQLTNLTEYAEKLGVEL